MSSASATATITLSRSDAELIAEWLECTDNPFIDEYTPDDGTYAASLAARYNLHHALYPQAFDGYCHEAGQGDSCGKEPTP